jgi:hypothetical protein
MMQTIPATRHCGMSKREPMVSRSSPLTSKPAEPMTITVDETRRVSGLLQLPPGAKACFVLAHGAGAGMRHSFLEALAGELGARDVATLRYQFPYMERGSRRPDPPKLCDATVRAAVFEAARLAPGTALIAGGKSFGGRMTSQAQAASPLPALQGIAFVGFPLHPPKQPSDKRFHHLLKVTIPMLFLQGTRDLFADLELFSPLIAKLGERATLKVFQGADHSFHVPARSGRKDAEVVADLAQALSDWIDTLNRPR